jgi:plastocyanin
MNLRDTTVSILVVAACVLTATSPRAEEVEVKIENFTFNPGVVTIEAGTTVRWRNDDDIPHSIVDAAAGIHSKALDTDDTTEVTFATPGTYDYVCGLHPQMKGTIEVLP